MKKSNTRWIVTIVSIAFILSLLLSVMSSIIFKNVGLILAIVVTFFFILLGIIFDIIGVADTCADIEVFHAMASRKIRGGKVGVKLIQNASKVSSICCDVVGDICGIISGSAGVVIVAIIINISNYNEIIVSSMVMALISALTIGGKAIGKEMAIKKKNEVITTVSKLLSIFKRS